MVLPTESGLPHACRPPASSSWWADIGMKIPVGSEIATYLESMMPVAHGEAIWAGGTTLRLTYYVGTVRPPAGYVSSVRCLLLKGARVLIVRSTDGTHHLLPGGRREDGESLLETLRRELLEETGCTASAIRQLGVVHFHHLRRPRRGTSTPTPTSFGLCSAVRLVSRWSNQGLTIGRPRHSSDLPTTWPTWVCPAETTHSCRMP